MNEPDTQPADDSGELCRFLASPQAYPEPTSQVQCLETHISRVFLTDEFAYKLKKPVRFDFLDFSTADQRHQACLAELALNRRLAADVYLEVLPITRSSDGGFSIGRDGPAVDWLVKMRRLNEPQTLLAAIRQAKVTPAEIASLADLLAAFYGSQPPLSLSADEYRAHIDEHVRANCAALLSDEISLAPHVVRRVHAAQLVYLALHPDHFDARIAAGRVVDGHGDLRPEHVYLTNPPVVIDCIEFNAEFRQVDLLDELSFLEAECIRLQAEEAGAAIREKCLALLNDSAPRELAAFYKSYRACVRAKVAGLRAKQLPTPQARQQLAVAAQYLELADQFDEVLGPPFLLLVRGLSGTGKSTIARALSDRLAIETLQTDAVRQELVTLGKIPSGPETAKYDPSNRQQVYDQLLQSAERLLAEHGSVILDGTFLSAQNIARAGQLAVRYRTRWLIIHCQCPVEVAQARIAARRQTGASPSEARPELVEQQIDVNPSDHPDWPLIGCDTTRPVPALVQEIIEHLRRFEP